MYIFWRRIFRSAISGFRRNGWLSLVAVIIMAQALLIVSILASLNMVIGASIDSINERIDVAIFFKDTVQEADIQNLKATAERYDGVREVIYVSSQEAYGKFLEENRNRSIIREVVPENDNFLPASIEIKVEDPDLIEGVVNQVKASQYGNLISETSLEDNQKLIERLQNVGDFVQQVSLILALVLIIIALLIIFNTIRITIFTRRQEIEIMKLVGATDWYIRWPFLVEGMIYAVVATFVTMGIIGILYVSLIQPLLEKNLISSGNNDMFSVSFFIFLAILQLVLSLSVGTMSSYWATKKHLNI